MEPTVLRQKRDDASADTWFRGQLPQLWSALDHLVRWVHKQKAGGSSLATSEILRTVASAIRSSAGPAQELKKDKIVRLVSQDLNREMDTLAHAADLYVGLDARLRNVCSALIALTEAKAPSIDRDIASKLPSILKLFDAARGYENSLTDVELTGMMLRALSCLSLGTSEFNGLAKPWGSIVLRRAFTSNNNLERVTALSTLTFLRETHDAFLRALWADEAPRIAGARPGSDVDSDLVRLGHTILPSGSPETRKALAYWAQVLETKLTAPKIISLPEGAIVDRLLDELDEQLFAIAGRHDYSPDEAIGIARAARLIAASGFSSVVVYQGSQETRVAHALDSLAQSEARGAITVPNVRYKGLHALVVSLIVSLVVVTWYVNPLFTPVAVAIAGAAYIIIGIALK